MSPSQRLERVTISDEQIPEIRVKVISFNNSLQKIEF